MSAYLLHHLLDGNGADAARAAVVHGTRTVDYGTFAATARRYAGALRTVGLGRGDRVALLLEKGPEECCAIFAVSRADGVLVPVHPALRPQQVRHILQDCGARVLVTTERLLKPLWSALEGLSDLAAVLTLDGAAAQDAHGVPVVPMPSVSNGQDGAPNTAIGEDLAAILYTSGSTGAPKGVMLSHRNLLAGTRIVRTYLNVTGRDRILSILPFSFDYGLNQLLTAVEQGACLVPFGFQFGDQIVDALRQHEITGLAGVPTIWAVLTRATPSLATTPLPHLRYITNSGGAVPADTVAKLRQLLPTTDIFLMYGLTEAFRSTYLPPEEVDRRPTSIGKAIPECEVFAVDRQGVPVPPGTPGILVHRGPTVSLGYWNRPEDTARVIRPNPLRATDKGGDMVCVSGDLVMQDKDGFFYFVGRDDAMIKSSGYRISPCEVEEALAATRLFRQVAVVGLPDAAVGQRVHAVAVPVTSDIDVRAALSACAKSLAAYMVPREIELVDRLPTSPNGKIDYKALVRERAANAP